MKKFLIIFVILFVSAFVLCGAVSAADVKTSNINTVKMSNVGITYYDQDEPAIDGNRTVWSQEDSSGNSNIYYKNIATGSIRKVMPSTEYQYNPDISGTRVVWQQYGVVYVKNIATGACAIVKPSGQRQINPAISGNIVVWEQLDSGGFGLIYYKNLVTGISGKVNLKNIQYSQSNPDISGTRVVWTEEDTICVKNLETGSFGRVLPSADVQDHAKISGTRIVWEQTKSYSTSIYYKNLATGSISKIQSSATNPSIDGSRIVWTQYSPATGTRAIYVKNLATGAYTKVQSSTRNQGAASISGTQIIWVEDFNYYSAIYTKNLVTGKYVRLII